MHEDHFLILCLYVDDLIYTSTDARMIEDFKKTKMQEYEMIDFGLMKYFLGMQVKQRCGQIFISQEKYANNLLKKFNMKDYKPLATGIMRKCLMSVQKKYVIL